MWIRCKKNYSYDAIINSKAVVKVLVIDNTIYAYTDTDDSYIVSFLADKKGYFGVCSETTFDAFVRALREDWPMFCGFLDSKDPDVLKDKMKRKKKEKNGVKVNNAYIVVKRLKDNIELHRYYRDGESYSAIVEVDAYRQKRRELAACKTECEGEMLAIFEDKLGD